MNTISISRVFQPIPLQPNALIQLDEPASHHLARVLRATINDTLIIFNGDGGAVDRADDGLQAVEDAQGDAATAVAHAFMAPVDLAIRHDGRVRLFRTVLARGIVEGLGARREVGAGAEGTALAGDDDGADVIVGVRPVEGVDQLRHHLAGEGIELFRAMQREGEDVIRHLVFYRLVGHSFRSLSGAVTFNSVLLILFCAAHPAAPLRQLHSRRRKLTSTSSCCVFAPDGPGISWVQI